MKTNYIFKTIFALLFTVILGQQADAQIRMISVDPAGDTITIKNFGSSTVDIGSYRLCSLFSYITLSSQTTVVNGSLNLTPGAEVTVLASNYLSFSASAADLGLYLPTGNFGTAANMVDFTQWGAGGQGRESVAVAKGIWTAGTFVNVSPPYQFDGNSSDFGANFWSTLISSQFKLVEVDPVADTVTIKNFGSTTEDIGAYRLCSLISYRTLSSQTTVVSGSLNLGPNDEVTVSISGDWLDDTAADLGLYLPTGSFGSPANMIDFTQWGSSPNGRESVAVSKGIWTAGTFINVSPPYEFNGGSADFGVTFWDTLLSVDDLNATSSFSLYPNPSSSILNIELNGNQTDLTYEVFDILGKQITSETFSNGNLSQIDVSNWNTGLYLIKLSNGDKTETKRFVKQ